VKITPDMRAESGGALLDLADYQDDDGTGVKVTEDGGRARVKVDSYDHQHPSHPRLSTNQGGQHQPSPPGARWNEPGPPRIFAQVRRCRLRPGFRRRRGACFLQNPQRVLLAP
jgi:hypothetical protein